MDTVLKILAFTISLVSLRHILWRNKEKADVNEEKPLERELVCTELGELTDILN